MRERMRTTALLMAAVAAGYVGGLMGHTSSANVARAEPAGAARAFSEVVRAKMFVLSDSEGVTRGLFTMDEGEAELVIIGSDGKARGVFSTDKDNVGLAIRDSEGNRRGLFGTDKNGPKLAIFDSDGRPVWKAP